MRRGRGRFDPRDIGCTTDWTAKLNDVHPDGTSVLISYGIQRARYRVSEARPRLITPHKVYKYTIEVWPTSASEPTPRLKVARQTILHNRKRASSIALPHAGTAQLVHKPTPSPPRP